VKLSAYVPCHNNAATLKSAVLSLLAQSVPIDDLFILDDGSTDGSGALADTLQVRVIHHPQNFGRGAARSRAMNEAKHELVLCCDATNVLPADYLQQALPWFNDAKVAAVYGRITQTDNSGVAQRWRGRHLYQMNEPAQITHKAKLATYGAVMRKSAVMAVGNFDPSLRHSEDAELGNRLLASGYDVVWDPKLPVISIEQNTMFEVLERYWRWNTAKHGPIGLRAYAKTIVFSFKVLARKDLRAGDPFSAFISLFSPHYQFWKSRLTR